MQKLPPEEALRRRRARSKKHNDIKKLEYAAYKLEHGIIQTHVSEARKEQMRLYARAKRAEAKANRPPKEIKVKPDRPAKTVKPAKITTSVLKPKVMPRAKTQKSQPRVFKTLNEDLSAKTRVRINSKTVIYVRPGHDIEQAKARYLNR